MSHDVFICHASEDKAALVRPLAHALRARNIDVWYDEFSMRVGDSLRQAIDRGLAASRFGAVVLSPAFFEKGWPQWELDGLVARLTAERRPLILPIWHDVGSDEVRRYSPSLAGIVAAPSSAGVDAICEQLLQVIRPAGSPLEIAKQILVDYGWSPPPISDLWWIDMVGLESNILSSYGAGRGWLFPHPPVGPAHDRGNAIAWAALQNEWSCDVHELGICQITRPDKVLEFIDGNAALVDAVDAHPEVVANYTPQLLIPQFSGRFAAAFDGLLAQSEAKIRDEPDSRYPDATCEKGMALRASNYGGHCPEDVAYKWMKGASGDQTAFHHYITDYVMWLLSDDSRWLPEPVRRTLTEGMRSYGRWPVDLNQEELWGQILPHAIRVQRRMPFNWTRSRRRELQEVAAASLQRLKVAGDPVRMAAAFIDQDFVGAIDRLRRGGPALVSDPMPARQGDTSESLR
jgi:hypothetical protein